MRNTTTGPTGTDDPQDPEHDPIGDAETEHDIEYDADPEDDGQPSEYEEWQDYMGGDGLGSGAIRLVTRCPV